MTTSGNSGKPRVAFYWCAGCGGCEETIIDLEERVLDLIQAVDIVFWPIALDFKRSDLDKIPDGSLFASFVSGAVRNEEQIEMTQLLRKKSHVVVAFGACAQLGGIPGLANLCDWAAVLREVYIDCPSVDVADGPVPQHSSSDEGRTSLLPEFLPRVRTVDQVVDVDYYIPGCPPTADTVWNALQTLLGADLPPKGSILASDQALCHDCPRKDSKPEDLALAGFKHPHELVADTTKCLLAQGVLCLGPATRGGCDARCIRGNMPCTGCYGPVAGARDFGAKALSAIASIIDTKDAEELTKIADQIPDVVGTFYRYSLPASMLAHHNGSHVRRERRSKSEEVK